MQKLSKQREKSTLKLVENVLSGNKKGAIKALDQLVKSRIREQIKKVSETETLL